MIATSGEPPFETALAAASRVARGTVCEADLREQALARIGALNPTLNAVVELAPRDPASLDGPLAGVPITVKEAIPVAGLRSTWGMPRHRDAVATADAEVVRRLRAAGARIIGTTNASTMLADIAATENELYGRTANPWDQRRTTGGSSGGSAAAVAAGLSYLDYGTDLAGSLRIPAALCGVYTLRPSVATVPLTGFGPPGAQRVQSEQAYLSALGPVCRSAGDLRAALIATGGPDGAAASAYRWRLAAARHTSMRDYRIAIVIDAPQAPVSAAVGARVAAVADALGSAATVVEGWPPGVDPSRSAALFGQQVEAFFVLQGIEAGTGLSLPDFAAAEAGRMAVRGAWQAYFRDFDVFCCPVTPTTAPAWEDRPGDGFGWWTTHASLAGLPAASVPIGIGSDGLPVGLQVIGPPHEDDTVIRFAELLGELIGGFVAPPPHRRESPREERAIRSPTSRARVSRRGGGSASTPLAGPPRPAGSVVPDRPARPRT